MNNEQEQTTMTDNLLSDFGTELRAAREALGLEQKDIALQLRLNERFIAMIEAGDIQNGPPLMFMRGYMRSYSKLVGIPEDRVTTVLDSLQPKAPITPSIVNSTVPAPLTSNNHVMRLGTSLIVLTLVGLVGTWWYSHSSTTLENPATPVPIATNSQPINLPMVTTNLASAPKLADASTAPTAPNTAPAQVSTNHLDANGSVDQHSLDSNDKVDRHSLDSNSNVDRHSLDDDDADDNENND